MSDEAAVECPCSACGSSAATFTALRAGEGVGLLSTRERLERAGWFGTLTRPSPFEEALALVARIREGKLSELAARDPDAFGFFCRACGRSYCEKCWSIDAPEFDDGFYDCTRGTCPEGHDQVLDD